jgi:hypothetical protein
MIHPRLIGLEQLGAMTRQHSLAALLGLALVAAPAFIDPADAQRRRNNRPLPDSQQATSTSRDAVYYRNCAEARAAGVAPLYRGQPGYRPQMDGDGDGVACEPFRGRR